METDKAAADLKPRKQMHWDVVINDMRSSRKCVLFKQILAKWINRYKREGAKEGVLQLMRAEMVRAGVRFLVREKDGFVLASSDSDVLDCIERALRQMLKAQKLNPLQLADEQQFQAWSAVAAAPRAMPLPPRGYVWHNLHAEHGRLAIPPHVGARAPNVVPVPPTRPVPTVNFQDGDETAATATVPRRAEPSRESKPESSMRLPGGMVSQASLLARPMFPSGESEHLVRRLQAETAVLEIRLELLEGRVKRLETILTGIGAQSETQQSWQT